MKEKEKEAKGEPKACGKRGKVKRFLHGQVPVTRSKVCKELPITIGKLYSLCWNYLYNTPFGAIRHDLTHSFKRDAFGTAHFFFVIRY